MSCCFDQTTAGNENPSGHISLAQVANHNTGFGLSSLLVEQDVAM